jgi:hypothetical protein
MDKVCQRIFMKLINDLLLIKYLRILVYEGSS